MVHSYREHPCENEDQIDEKHLHPAQVVKLRITDKSGLIHYICYDVVGLVNYFFANYRSTNDWKDPTYDRFLTADQVNLIIKLYEQLNVCKNSRTNTLKVRSGPLTGPGPGSVPSLGTKPPTLGRPQETKISIPRSMFDQDIDRAKGYLIYRLINPKRQTYTYIVVTDYHPDDGYINIPNYIMGSLELEEDQQVVLEDCFNIPKLQVLILHPEDPQWNTLPISAIDEIGQELTREIEKLYILSIGDLVTINYGGNDYTLRVYDMLSNGKRTPSALTKFTEVKVNFI